MDFSALRSLVRFAIMNTGGMLLSEIEAKSSRLASELKKVPPWLVVIAKDSDGRVRELHLPGQPI